MSTELHEIRPVRIYESVALKHKHILINTDIKCIMQNLKQSDCFRLFVTLVKRASFFHTFLRNVWMNEGIWVLYLKCTNKDLKYGCRAVADCVPCSGLMWSKWFSSKCFFFFACLRFHLCSIACSQCLPSKDYM